MKIISALTLIWIALVSGLMAQSFEGTVVMTHSLHEGMESTFHIKNGQAVMEAKGPGIHAGMRTIINPAAGTYQVITATSGQVQSMKYDINDPSVALGNSGQKAGSASFSKTGETKMMGAYLCEKYLIKNEGDLAEVWIAAELKDLDLTQYLTGVSLRREGKFLANDGVEGFVMEIHGVDKRSGKAYIIKNKVQEGNVDMGKFNIPAGTKVIDMSQLKQQVEDAGNDRDKLKEIKEGLDQN